MLRTCHILDNGPEFIAAAILRWLGDAGIDTALIDPGKPCQNATDESFNGKLRDECLSLQWFRNRMDAKGQNAYIERFNRSYRTEVAPPPRGRVQCRQRLGGMLNYYYRSAA